jgi:tripartite-type tricarboxylate transporter receptor subunit TctC
VERLEDAGRGRRGTPRPDLGRRELGSTSHVPGIDREAAGSFKYVSYEGLAPRMNAILGGHVDLTDANMTQKGKVEAGS